MGSEHGFLFVPEPVTTSRVLRTFLFRSLNDAQRQAILDTAERIKVFRLGVNGASIRTKAVRNLDHGSVPDGLANVIKGRSEALTPLILKSTLAATAKDALQSTPQVLTTRRSRRYIGGSTDWRHKGGGGRQESPQKRGNENGVVAKNEHVVGNVCDLMPADLGERTASNTNEMTPAEDPKRYFTRS